MRLSCNAVVHQVFNVQNETDVADDIATRFPNIKIVHWFDYRKLEVEAQVRPQHG